MDGEHFRKLPSGDASNQVWPFSIDELKYAVWDCVSYKSMGPDGTRFGFIK